MIRLDQPQAVHSLKEKCLSKDRLDVLKTDVEAEKITHSSCFF